MFSMKLLLGFSLLTGIFAEQCNIADFGVEDVSDKVTVTNVSATADAFVALKFNHGQVTMVIPAGKSRSAIALAATKYQVTVVGPGDNEYVSYQERLLDLRNRLLDVMSSGATLDQMATTATDLTLVQSALEQLNGSDTTQSCGGTLKTGVTSQVTVNRTQAATGGVKLWVLDCG